MHSAFGILIAIFQDTSLLFWYTLDTIDIRSSQIDCYKKLRKMCMPPSQKKAKRIKYQCWNMAQGPSGSFFFFLKKVFFLRNKLIHSNRCGANQPYKFLSFFFKKRESVETQDYIFSILDTKIGKEKAVLLQLFFHVQIL